MTTKKDLGMVLILISYYAIVINGKTKKYNLSMVLKLELYEIVLQKHTKQLDSLIFKVLQENSIAQSVHVVTTKFAWFFDTKEADKKRKEKQHQQQHRTTRTLNVYIIAYFQMNYKYLKVVK